MFWIDTVEMSTVSNAGKNRLTFVNWGGKSSVVEVALPREALSIAVFDDKRLAHLTIGAPNAGLRLVCLDAPYMPAPITDSFILFHRISVSVLPESLRSDNRGRRLEVLARERKLGAGRRSEPELVP